MPRKIILLLIIVLSSFRSVLFSNEPIRILAIGNSFSEDAVENYLHDIAKAGGVSLIIGNMYIGGCSLETHWNNAKNNSKAYAYRKIDVAGDKKTIANVSISEAIADEKWDYITFQQVSQNSGISTTYLPYLPNLLDFVKEKAANEDVKYAVHMTWAYSEDSEHAGFPNYGKDQMRMYNAIVDATTSVAETVGIDIVIPSGTAIQNARTSFIGDKFCRDGYHLDLGVGRYTAACTWYEKLTGNSVVENDDAPASILPLYVEIAKRAAHNAVQIPNEVTDMSGDGPFPDPETFELVAPVNIDLSKAIVN